MVAEIKNWHGGREEDRKREKLRGFQEQKKGNSNEKYNDDEDEGERKRVRHEEREGRRRS